MSQIRFLPKLHGAEFISNAQREIGGCLMDNELELLLKEGDVASFEEFSHNFLGVTTRKPRKSFVWIRGIQTETRAPDLPNTNQVLTNRLLGGCLPVNPLL
jgi:hypothetical protein